MKRQTYRQTDGQTDIQTEGQTDIQTDRQEQVVLTHKLILTLHLHKQPYINN